MSDLISQLRDLDELHQKGVLNDAEFAAAKGQLLNGAAASKHENSLLELQNELARVDREWELERERFKVAGRYNSSIPNTGDGGKASLIITIFGTVWTGVALTMAIGISSSGAPTPMIFFFWIFPLFGVFFVVSGLAKGAEMTQKAADHLEAERQYQERRAKILAQIENAARN